MSGHRNRLGLYMSKVKGTDFIVIHTKRDPVGKLNGSLRWGSYAITTQLLRRIVVKNPLR